MSGVTLTSAMRNNLLSLRRLSSQMSKTQEILSTGKKVNSAIDNASNFYQARSLTNRAADLMELLNSMDQGIRTIEAATVGLEQGAAFLEQATAVATEALTTAKIPAKEWFIDKVGANGAVVSTAQELKDAVAAGKETICVYGQIDLGDISNSAEITLSAGQKLVGVGYFGDFDTEVDKFSALTATANVAKSVLKITQAGCEISNLSINYHNTTEQASDCILVTGKTAKAVLSDLDLTISSQKNGKAIRFYSYATASLEGNINIKTIGNYTCGIYTRYEAQFVVEDNARINISTDGDHANGIYIYGGSMRVKDAQININTFGDNVYGMELVQGLFNIESGADISITGHGSNDRGIVSYMDAILNIAAGANLYIRDVNHGLFIESGTVLNIGGNLYIDAVQMMRNNSWGSCSTTNILSTARIYGTAKAREWFNNMRRYTDETGPNVLNVARGAQIALEKDGVVQWYELNSDYRDENNSTTTHNTIKTDNITTVLDLSATSAWTLPPDLNELVVADASDNNRDGLMVAGQNFKDILSEYDTMVADSSYQGVNLLTGGDVDVTFNETRSHRFTVAGQNMSAQALGLTTPEWQTQGDIARSLSEIAAALNSIRGFQAELGNHYGIIQTRQSFTEALADVLETGADDLVLADMNEASAEYLTLQTRQQLAINSLSLAAQSAQSILSVF